MATTVDSDLLWAFVDAIRRRRDADEFERLMVGSTTPTFDESLRKIDDSLDCCSISLALSDDEDGELTALSALRRDRAIERLSGRYPDVWERVTLARSGDPS